jgi:hypothetical protein
VWQCERRGSVADDSHPRWHRIQCAYLVELDAEPTLHATADAAMATLMKTWYWAT